MNNSNVLLVLLLCVALILSGCSSSRRYISSETSLNPKGVLNHDDAEVQEKSARESAKESESASNNETTGAKAKNNGKSVTNSARDTDGVNEVSENISVSSGTWKQKTFYLSCALNPSSLEDIKAYRQCGYNMVECANFNSEQMEECLNSCELVGGIDVLFAQSSIQLPKAEGFTEQSVYEVVKKYKNYKCLMGYHIWDEITPGENYSNYILAQRMINYLNRFDPASFKYTLLLPSYGLYKWGDNLEFSWNQGNYEDYVEDYIQRMKPQVLSFDYYPYLVGTAGDTGDWFRDMGLYRKKSLQYNLPFWYYYQACKVNNTGPTPTEQQIRYQMYVGLAYGAKELSAWNGQWDGVYGAFYYTGGKTELYDTVKTRNAELRPLGEYLFDKTTTYIYHTGVAGYYTGKFFLDKLSDSSLIQSAPSRMIISVFEDGKTDTKYLLAVNKNTEKALKGTLKLKKSMHIYYFDSAKQKEVSMGAGFDFLLDLPAGGGALYILKSSINK